MNEFSKELEVRWSDLDPNFHLRHSVYYDFGAYCRMCFLNEQGITPVLMAQHHIGPIIFREECIYKREIKFGDQVMINFSIAKVAADFSKWTMQHEIWKNGDTLSAILAVDGAWMDTRLRKITAPPPVFITVFEAIPKALNFNK